ncbi:TPA: hypothetical protein QCY05_004374 [Bacillus wiedmannii]|nr:hypothetical protein [Bacillus wiedmannii]
MKKAFVLFLSVFLVLFSFSSSSSVANAEEKSVKDTMQIDLLKIKNFNDVLDSLSQDKKDIISSFWFDETIKSGVINIYNKDENKYYNLYVEKDRITYYSTQYYIDSKKEDANFELYSINKDNSFEYEFTSSIVKETGQVQHSMAKAAVSNSVYKWACIFSSRVACVAAAGTLGFGVAGPFGATAAVAACGYLFGTLVEKYGSKGAACKILS